MSFEEEVFNRLCVLDPDELFDVLSIDNEELLTWLAEDGLIDFEDAALKLAIPQPENFYTTDDSDLGHDET